MMRLNVILAVTALAIPLFARDDDKPRIRLAGIGVGMGYNSGWGYGPGFYRPWWGLYDPFWSSGWVHSGLYRGFAQGPNMGQIKLQADKDATVFLDGAFAGTASKLKSIWLEPGIYELQVVNPDGDEYKRKVYVLSGKTLNIRPGAKP